MLFSVHLKATMMKVSDPIIFGHVVQAFFPDVFAQYGDDARRRRPEPERRPRRHPRGPRRAARAAPRSRPPFDAGLADGPALAMVDSDKGITNLHVPSDVIVDASMPAMIRTSGHMWGPDGEEARHARGDPRLARYAGIYQVVIDDCRAHGAFDPATMGSVPNVGLMAQAAEEYGSPRQDLRDPGRRHGPRRRRRRRRCCSSTPSSAGDIWRACQTKDVPIRDWVKLAVTRARATGAPAVFWLDETRAHDANLIAKVEQYLAEHDTDGLRRSRSWRPVDAIAFSLERIRQGEDTISVTGNVLRDYLTDLFPILELGTSAKMLSVVPLINGGGLFETGAGGSAPKHVQQLVKENYLRWDSLGEFLALAVSFEHLRRRHRQRRAPRSSPTRSTAPPARSSTRTSRPARKVGEIDNRGSHFYLALYWAQELAAQTDDAELAAAFAPLAETLAEQRGRRSSTSCSPSRARPVDIGGYYRPDDDARRRGDAPVEDVQRGAGGARPLLTGSSWGPVRSSGRGPRAFSRSGRTAPRAPRPRARRGPRAARRRPRRSRPTRRRRRPRRRPSTQRRPRSSAASRPAGAPVVRLAGEQRRPGRRSSSG